jgi:hypothetical protein
VLADEGTSVWVFAGPLLGFHLVLMLVTNVLLLQVRHVTDRYQESKYVAFASMLMFEILIVGFPVMIAVNDSPTATFIVLTGIIALDDIGILCFIFVPKIRFQIEGLEEGVGFGESIMKNTLKRASTRESVRSASFSMPLSSTPMKTSPFSNSMVDSFSCESILEDSINEETSEELREEGSSQLNLLYTNNDDVDSQTPPIEEVHEKKRSIETYLANRVRVGPFRKKENEEASERAPGSAVSPTTASLLTEPEQVKWSKGADGNSPPSTQIIASEDAPAKVMQLQMYSLGTTSSTASISVDEQVSRGAADGDVSEAPEHDVTPADEAMPESGDAEPEADSSPAVEYAEQGIDTL